MDQNEPELNWRNAHKFVRALLFDNNYEVPLIKDRTTPFLEILRNNEKVAAWIVSGKLGVTSDSCDPIISDLIDIEWTLSENEMYYILDEISSFYEKKYSNLR